MRKICESEVQSVVFVAVGSLVFRVAWTNVIFIIVYMHYVIFQRLLMDWSKRARSAENDAIEKSGWLLGT